MSRKISPESNAKGDVENLEDLLVPNTKKILSLVLQWTGKEPFLTQILFKQMMESKELPKSGEELAWVENFMRSKVLKTWENNPHLRPLWNIRDRLIKNNDKKQSIQLLSLYQEILHQDILATEEQPQKDLRLLGLIVKQDKKVTVRSRIYREIFNRDWVKKSLETLKNQVEPDEEDYLKEFAELERKLLVSQGEIINQIEQGKTEKEASKPLYEVLRDVAVKVGEIVGCDRTTIFLLNDEKTELWSLVAEDESGQFLDIRVRVGEGVAGYVAKERQLVHIPDRVYEDPRSQRVKESDQKYNYHTKNILAFPILNDDREVIAVIQLLNKIPRNPSEPAGFTHIDLERLAKCVLPIRGILETCQSCYEAIKKAQANAALAEATRSLDQVDLDQKSILEQVMNAAKKLLNADRSTLWLFDEKRGDLWTELTSEGTIRCPMGVGFVGQVAQSRQPMIIPFDLYDDPNAENAKKTDALTHYRTCSLLCLPILSPEGELLGVSQLVNKRKTGFTQEYDKNQYPAVPKFFQASFDKNDRQSMQIFNERVASILQFSKTHEDLKKATQIEPQEAIKQTLDLFSEAVGEDGLELSPMASLLACLNTALKQSVKAEYCHIFLLNSQQKELWSLMMAPEKSKVKKVSISSEKGIAGKILIGNEAKRSNKIGQIKDDVISIGIPKDEQAKLKNILLFPLQGASKNSSIALIRFLNKVNSTEGFGVKDIEKIQKRTEGMVAILEAFQSYAEASQTSPIESELS